MEKTQTKLTLRLDRGLIDAAKRYAERRGTSVSQVVANYFEALVEPEQPSAEDWKAALPESVRALVDREPPRQAVIEDEYYRHLGEKHSRHLQRNRPGDAR